METDIQEELRAILNLYTSACINLRQGMDDGRFGYEEYIARVEASEADNIASLTSLIDREVKDKLLDVGLLAHKYEGESWHAREIADHVDETIKTLTPGGSDNETN